MRSLCSSEQMADEHAAANMLRDTDLRAKSGLQTGQC